MFNRKIFRWLSSKQLSNEDELQALQNEMTSYYSSSATRDGYNSLIEVKEEEGPDNVITAAFIDWMRTQKLQRIIEIGCGNGRVWKKLEETFDDISYTGVEIDADTIKRNLKRWPNQQWFNSSVYDLDFAKSLYDLCFSFYVLEHLVFPEQALNKMFGLVKPGGVLLLVFPDFSATRRFPSQRLSFEPERSTKAIIRKGYLLSAIIFYINGRRLARRLKKLPQSAGKFLVNTMPICLDYKEKMVWSDIDAVYLANKYEIEYWAKKNGALIEYPFGINAPFDENAFIVIKKPIGLENSR